MRIENVANGKIVKIENKNYKPVPVLKLTIENGFNPKNLTQAQRKNLSLLLKEAKLNNFKVVIK